MAAESRHFGLSLKKLYDDAHSSLEGIRERSDHERVAQQAQDEDPRGAGAEAAGGSQECAQNEGGVEEGERIKRKEMTLMDR